MNRIYYFVFLALSISACQDKENFWPIEQFDITDNGLDDNQLVKLIYYSSGPYDDQVDQGFYRHAVVISTETNDTINILTFPNPDLDNLSPTNNVMIYSNQPNVRKSILNYDFLTEEMKKRIEKIDTTNLSWPKYSIVTRDPDFDYIAKNNFKTVIGTLTKN